MTAVIYARYSSDNQREESIEGQIRECTAYAEKNGMTVVKHYIDRAYSAKTANRPEFQQMVKDSEKRLFDVVLVWKIDRFARDRYDAAHYKHILQRNHVKLVSATEPISDTPAGIMMESMLTGMAEYYSAELSEKVVRGMTENVLKGKYNGGTVPIGYRIDENRFFQIDPLKAPFVVEAFKKYNEGATMKEIMNWLNQQGVTTNRNQKFTYNSVQTLLTNRRYIGENRFQDIVMPDTVPVIVDKELFERVQEKIAKNRRAPARHKAEDDYLLTTKLFCGMCGAMMFGECGTARNKTVYHYYKCANAKRTRSCKKKTVRKVWLEDLVVNATLEMLQDDKTIDAIVEMVMHLQDQENTALPLLEKQLKEVDSGIQNMLNAIQAGILTSSTKERLEALEAQKKELEIRITEEKLAKPKLSPDFVRFWLTRFRKLDPHIKSHRETLINTFVNAIYLYDEKVLITFNYKDGLKTISLGDVAASAAPEGSGSDLDGLGPPNFFVCKKCGARHEENRTCPAAGPVFAGERRGSGAEIICDLAHPGHLVHMEGTAAVAVAAGQAGGSLAAQVGVVVPGQGVTGLGQIVIAAAYVFSMGRRSQGVQMLRGQAALQHGPQGVGALPHLAVGQQVGMVPYIEIGDIAAAVDFGHVGPGHQSRGLAQVLADLDAVLLKDQGIDPARAAQQTHPFGLGVQAVLVAQIPHQRHAQTQHHQDSAQQQRPLLGIAGITQHRGKGEDGGEQDRPAPQLLAPEGVKQGKAAECGPVQLHRNIDGSLFHGGSPYRLRPAGAQRKMYLFKSKRKRQNLQVRSGRIRDVYKNWP